jgi:hypothetical protein
VSNQNKLLAIAAVVALFGGLIYYTTGAMTSKFKFDPDKAFKTAFDEDPARVEGPLFIKKADDGSYDMWMHFKYPHEAKMKHEAEFKPAFAAETASWFSRHLPPGDDKGLQDINHIKFRRRIDNQNVDVTNEWIIYNPRTDEHFYRTWGTQR